MTGGKTGQIKECSTKVSSTRLKIVLHHRLMIHKGGFPINSPAHKQRHIRSTMFTVTERFSAPVRAGYLQHFLSWHILLAGTTDLLQRVVQWRNTKEKSAGSAASSFNETLSYSIVARLAVFDYPLRHCWSTKPLHSACLDKCKWSQYHRNTVFMMEKSLARGQLQQPVIC